MIELSGFSKKYSDKSDFVVKDINLTAKKGSVTGLLGLNGAGKTTIIKAICGLHFATEGTVNVTGTIGFVPEIYQLPENLYVAEFLLNVQKIHANNEDLFWKTVELCELQSVLNRRIKSLSKGFRQRIVFAQALIYNPDNLILDEPVNGLDPAQIIQFRKIIKKAAESKTVLISTHIMQEVESLCTDIHILHKGKIIESGTLKEILNKTKSNNIEEAFLKITSDRGDA